MVNSSGKELVMELHVPKVFSYLHCLSFSSTTWVILQDTPALQLKL